MSKRLEIIRHVVRALKEGVLQCVVMTAQVRALETEDLPCVVVTIPSESAEVFALANQLEVKKTATLLIQLFIEGEPQSEEFLHEISAQVERLILRDDSFGNLISRVDPASVEITTNFEGGFPIGMASIKFNVSYFEIMSPDVELNPLRRVILDMESYAVQ